MNVDPAGRYRSIIEHNPFDHPGWEGLVTVCFAYPSSGWILFWIAATSYNQDITIHCSFAFDPFFELVHWLEEIVQDHLPCACTIDEEGNYRTLRVDRLADDLLDFQIYAGDLDDWESEETPILLRTKVAKRQLVGEMVKKLTMFAAEYDQPDQWYAVWDEPPEQESAFSSLNLEPLVEYLRANPES